MSAVALNTPFGVSVLEDHALVRESLVQILSSAGLRVISAASTPIEFFANLHQDPSVAIVDLTLDAEGRVGSVNGRDVLARLRHDHPQVRPLVFTGDRSHTTVMECHELGAWGFLDKLSARGPDLVNAIKRVADGERSFPLYALDVTPPKTTAPAVPPALAKVSTREREVLSFISGGADNLKISCFLGITERTVRAHVSSLYRKLGSENRTHLALLARQLGIDPPPGI